MINCMKQLNTKGIKMISNSKLRLTNSSDSTEFELGAKRELLHTGNKNDAPGSASGSGQVPPSHNIPRGTHLPEKPKTLDEQIEEAKFLYETSVGERLSKQVIESAQLTYSNLCKQKIAQLTADAQMATASASTANTTATNQANERIARGHDQAAVRVAQISKETEVIRQDPTNLSQLEMQVLDIVKKYDVLKDVSAFASLVNTSTEKQIKTDALTLERGLKKLGFNLNVDGKIDDKTIQSLEAMISKNAPAIQLYKQVTGNDPLRPSDSPVTKPVQIEIQ